MLNLFLFGVFIGGVIIFIVSRGNSLKPKIKEKSEDNEEKNQQEIIKEEILEKKEEVIPPNVKFSEEEIRQRQERILGNMSEKERKLFLDFINEQKSNKNKNNSYVEKNGSRALFDIVINLFVIAAVGGLIYYAMQ